MHTNPLGKTQLKVSTLGFGGAPIAYLETEQDRISHVLALLLDHGVNLIDTAACYQASEESIGRAVAHRRSEYILVSKCGHQVDQTQGAEFSAQLVNQTVDRALRRLRTDYLDVMLLHSCTLKTLQQGDALESLVKARDQGKIRFAGYSGDNEAVTYAAGLPEVSVVQTSVSICDQANIDQGVAKAGKTNVGVIAKRPIANAAWKDLSDQPGMYANYAKTYTDRLQQMGVTPSEFGFEGEPSEQWPEMALRFTLSIPGVHTAIIGTTNPNHVVANIAAAQKGPLPDEAVARLRLAFEAAQRRVAESWTGQT